ncbi:hypothetical protein Tco_1383812 [Tanacetum coccineum]
MFKRRLIAADQASVFMEMMSVHISSGLVLHQMTSDHNRSELGIQDHSNEQSSSKLVPKVVLKNEKEHPSDTYVFTMKMEILLEPASNKTTSWTQLIADIEDDIMDPVMQCTTLPSHSGFSQQKLVSFVTEIHTLSIDISLRDC